VTRPDAPAATGSQPGLVRLLRLRHLRLAGWQRFVLGDVPIVAAVLLVLADLASAWLLVALPAAVGAMVKLHDVVAGRLGRLDRVSGDQG